MRCCQVRSLGLGWKQEEEVRQMGERGRRVMDRAVGQQEDSRKTHRERAVLRAHLPHLRVAQGSEAGCPV